MEQYVIKGGVRLQGEVSIGGAKNAALGILAAAIMTDETVTIENVPNVRDIRVLLQAIEGIGAKVTYVYNNSVQINGGSISDINVDYEYIKKIRASYYLLGALLGKYKESQVALPGGCPAAATSAACAPLTSTSRALRLWVRKWIFPTERFIQRQKSLWAATFILMS